MRCGFYEKEITPPLGQSVPGYFCARPAMDVWDKLYAKAAVFEGENGIVAVLILDAVFMWLIVIPLASLAAFVFHLDPIIVFICLKCDQILKCGVAFIRVNCCKYRWIKKIDRGTEVVES